MMNPQKETCTNCHFWESVEDEDGHILGECRRFPPSYQGWPMTDARKWCGEFMPQT